MHKQISILHYITQDLPGFSHIEQVGMACKAGLDWIQLRMKQPSLQERQSIAREARAITRACNCTLIINDDVLIAAEVKADGVHLGREDMHWSSARQLLGDDAIIGVSVHSWQELDGFRHAEVDYAGLGPFRFTTTKEKLDPILGLSGIRDVILKKQSDDFYLPLVAIGGIELDDVAGILQTGVSGIAVSSAINKNTAPSDMAKAFKQQLRLLTVKTQKVI